MKTQKIVAAVAAGALALCSVPTFAQSYLGKQADEQRAAEHLERTQSQQPGYRGNDSRGNDSRDSHWNGSNSNNRRDVRDNNNYNRDNNNRGNYNRGNYDNRGNYGRDDNRRDNDRWGHEGRGAGPDHAFYRGGRLPPEYSSRQYVVDDWRAHHLSAPPRGYHWVQTGGDYVLAAIATGVIASILLNQ